MPASPSPSAPTTLPRDKVAPCIRRGNQWLTENDLQAHLAAISRLDNVGVLLGAGASSGSLGGKTITELWDFFRKTFASSYTWLSNNAFLPKDPSAQPPNIEELGDCLEIARLEWKRKNDPKLQELCAAQADLKRAVIHAAILQEKWWSNPTELADFPPELFCHRQLLQKLTAARQPGQPAPWLFTTNYDLAIEWAAESLGLQVINGFAGLHLRTFSPHNFDLAYRNAVARGEARFGTYNIYLAKLHGSLTWRSIADQPVIEHPATLVADPLRKFLDGKTQDGQCYLVLPSAAKYLQTVGFVLGELFRRFTDFLTRPQTCLITCGYSYSDEHLNRILLSALQNPTLHLLVYLPEIARNDEQIVVPPDRPWLNRLVALSSPQVTIVGDASGAWLSSLVSDMPDPAIYDEQAVNIRKMMRDIRDFNRDLSS